MARNVVLVCLDSVRRDYFDQYAPRIKELTDTDITRCRAASSWSAPSHASIVTGDLPSEHGVHANQFSFTQLNASSSFLSGLDSHRTIGISANAYASSKFGFDRFFDEFYDYPYGNLFPGGLVIDEFLNRSNKSGIEKYLDFLKACLQHNSTVKSLLNGIWAKTPKLPNTPFPRLIDDGARQIAATAVNRADDSERPFFMFLNFMDAHTPHRPLIQHDRELHDVPNSWTSQVENKWDIYLDSRSDPEYTSNFRQLYAASIDYLDRVVVEIVKQIQEKTDRETTFIITSDHGENLGYPDEEHMIGHTGSLSEALLHTPCSIINSPDTWPAMKESYFSHLSIGPLVRAITNNEEMPDESFVDRVPAEEIGMSGLGKGAKGMTKDEFQYIDRMIRCVYDGDDKYEWDSLDRSFRYRIDHDGPSKQKQIAENIVLPEFVDEFFERDLQEYKGSVSERESSSDIPSTTQRRLADLGYL